MTDYKIIRKRDIFTFSSFFFLAIKLFFIENHLSLELDILEKGRVLCRVRRVLSASIYLSVFLQKEEKGREKDI